MYTHSVQGYSYENRFISFRFGKTKGTQYKKEIAIRRAKYLNLRTAYYVVRDYRTKVVVTNDRLF